MVKILKLGLVTILILSLVEMSYRDSKIKRVGSLSQSWILLAKKNMMLASHWLIFFIIILAIFNDIEGGQLRDELCCEGA